MKNALVLVIVSLFTFTAFAQTKKDNQTLNLDFEELSQGQPTGWVTYGSEGYTTSLDSTIFQNGKNSVCIEFKEGDVNFKAWALNFPAIYHGKKIKLTAYIKTENVSDGYAGLWMRIDPSVAFDNMSDRGITGTTDWNQYEIELNYKSSAKNIVVGGMLVGKGKMWLDKLEITMDGYALDEIPPKEPSLAELDKEFDKGSGISLNTLDEKMEDDLYHLGLIWGFLKYHHPVVAKGDVNWDYELFRILPRVLSSETRLERDELLSDWIKKLGDIESGKNNTEDSAEVKLSPDLEWINNSGYSAGLVKQLERVKDAKRDGINQYVSLVSMVGNPEFNEEAYAAMSYPDAGFRILSLFRYWNIIQYYFPYKNLIEEDWKGVLKEFLPKFISAGNELEYKLSALEIIGRVRDTHANIWGDNYTLNKYWGVDYAPLEIKFIENKAVVVDYFDDELGRQTGLQVGDIIERVNKEAVGEIVKRQLALTPASNYPTQLRDIAKKLLRTNDSIIEIEFNRDQKVETATIKAFSPNELGIYRRGIEKDTCFELLDDNVAYIHNGLLKRKDIPLIWKDIQNTKGLIIDIRNYPSDFPIYDLSGYLMNDANPFVKFSNCSIETPGRFTFTPTINAGIENGEYYSGKVVIIVNEITQSSAEFHSMAYRTHPKSVVIGSTTAGADGNVSGFFLPGNIRTMISGIGVYYPDGTETQGIGIVPDVEVHPTIESINQGRDILLEKAIAIIESD